MRFDVALSQKVDQVLGDHLLIVSYDNIATNGLLYKDEH